MILRAKGLSVGLVVGALVALGAMMTGGAAAAPSGDDTAVAAAKCQKSDNVEAIIDDSGSMGGTFGNDPGNLRVELLRALTQLGGASGKTLGAVEFGDTAGVLFAPVNMPEPALSAINVAAPQVAANNGATDYNLAFNTAAAANPNATSRIFLSDGGHNVGPYANLHLGVKTFVIGFGSVNSSVLQQIADDTGGFLELLTDASAVPSVAADILAAMECRRPPVVYTDTFTRDGQQFGHGFKPRGKNADMLITWPGAGIQITAVKFKQIVGGKVARKGTIAVSSKSRGVKAKKKGGANFTTIRLKGLKKKGKVKFKVKARDLAVPTVATTKVVR
ncbi:MAG: hypothetical protein ACRDKH_05475 [Solirubrobacterales bacterium]